MFKRSNCMWECKAAPGQESKAAGQHGKEAELETPWHTAIAILLEQVLDDVV